MKKLILIIALTLISLQGIAQKFPLDVKVRWGEVQKVKTLGHFVYFDPQSDGVFVNFVYSGIQDSKGVMAKVLNTFELDTNSLDLTFREEDKAYHKHQGTNNFIVNSTIPNYKEAVRSGYAVLKDVEMKCEFTIASRTDESKSKIIKDVVSDVAYFEFDDLLFFIVQDSIEFKVIQFDHSGNSQEYLFDPKLFFDHPFEILSTSILDGGDEENLRLCYVLKYREGEAQKMCVLQVNLNLPNGTASASKCNIQLEGDKISDNLLSCDIYYLDEKDGKVDNIALKFAKMVTGGTGANTTYYVRHSPLYVMKNNNGVLEQQHSLSSASVMGNYSSISFLTRFKGRYLYVGSGFTNHYKSKENVDFSDTGDKGSIPHLILDYIGGDDKEYYKTLAVSGVKNLFGSSICVRSSPEDDIFKAYVIVYSGSVGRVPKARVAEILIK